MRVRDAIRVQDGAAWIDPELFTLGHEHLEAVRQRSPTAHDGVVLVFQHFDGDTLIAQRGGYFAMIATADALRAEAIGDPNDRGPLRRRALALSENRPMQSGFGRAAAVGVSVVTTVGVAFGRAAILGRRRTDLATDPGHWHVVPSGMIEPAPPGEDPLLTTIARELREELGLSITGLENRLQMLGIAYDEARMRPEICLRLDLDVNESEGASPRGEEYDIADIVPIPFTDLELQRPLTPPARGALALLDLQHGALAEGAS